MECKIFFKGLYFVTINRVTEYNHIPLINAITFYFCDYILFALFIDISCLMLVSGFCDSSPICLLGIS